MGTWVISQDDPGVDAIAQVAQNLLQARKLRGLTQEEVSDRSGVHPTEISRIENGHRDVQVSTIFKLARAFDLTPGQFIDGDLATMTAATNQN
jgi:transcriptional regulator with XRE-family HTH domain